MWNMLGLGATASPTYDSTAPFKTVDKESAAKLVESQHKQFNELQNDKEWELYNNWTDTEGGDMHLWDRPQMGTFHFCKATFSVDCTPAEFVALVGSNELSVRNKFSADCVGMTELDKPTADSSILHAQYWAPPPVAGRDFCFLVANQKNGDGTEDLWGCSVDSALCPEEASMIVRGASLWGWRLIAAGDKTLVTYTNCFDPRGWAPSFLIAWMKTAVAKELMAIRAVCAGKEVKCEQVGLDEAGLNAADIASEVEKHESEKQ